MGAADAAAARRARIKLEELLRSADLSAADRVRHERTLLPAIVELVQSGSDASAINALLVAGDLATVDANRLLQQNVADPRPAVAYAAVVGMQRALESVARSGAAAISGGQLDPVVQTLAQQVETSADVALVGASARALLRVVEIRQSEFARFRTGGLQRLVDASSKRLQSIAGSGPSDLALLEEFVLVGERLQALILRERASLDSELVKRAGAMGGDIIAVVSRMVRAGALPQANPGEEGAGLTAELRERASVATRLGTSLVLRALDAIGRGRVPEQVPDLASEVAKASSSGDTAFVRGFQRDMVVGILAREPFSLPSERFTR